MTQTLHEARLSFDFPDDTLAVKYDDWAFYRNQLTNAFGGTKAVDIIHIDAEKTAWLIEIKDYRHNQRTKPSELSDEVALKVRDTLAGLVAAQFQAQNDEKQAARKVLRAKQLKVVIHLEQPQTPSKLFPQVIKPVDLQQQLKKRLKAVAPNAFVVDQHSLKRKINMDWTVRNRKPTRRIHTN